MKKSRAFKNMIESGQLVMVPGAYDAITASLIEKAGFPALYITGSGVSLSLLGHPDLNTVSYLEFRQVVENISYAVDIPIVADIDTGFGGPLNLIRLIKDFERMDIAAVQIEDQQAPKRCGHELGRRVVAIEEMIDRIRTIKDARDQEEGILIIARTDARTELGIDEAITRGKAYLEAGADIIFVESPESIDEVRQVTKEINGPVMFNNVEGGRSPFISRDVLQEIGVAMTIYPNALTRIMTKSAINLLQVLKKEGTTANLQDNMLSHKELFSLFDHDDWVALERQYLTNKGK